MDKVKMFREYTRELECHLGTLNSNDCCQCGVSETQCFLLVEIGRKPGICVKELAKILNLDKSSVSRGVEDLVQMDYVSREPSKKDRRRVALALTKSGENRFNKIEKDMYVKFKEIYERIDVNNREKVLEALKIYNEACEKVEVNCCDKRNE